jgi:superfamily I DNA and RNA helicase
MFGGKSADKLNVGVVCFNRALVSFLLAKIRDSFKQQTLQDLPGDLVTVKHYNGLFWPWAQHGILNYINIKEGEELQRANQYRQQIANLVGTNPELLRAIQFDAIFVDEGQDLIPEDYELLLDLIKPHPQTGEKALVIFYDDAQNLYARPRPNWSQIGIDVQRGARARVMKECFRNPREVVELAFNILLGVQAVDRTIRTRTFADINYLKQSGLIEELGDHFRVRFTERTFAKPSINKFRSLQDEKEWIGGEIVRLIQEESVRPEDILVLFAHSPDFNDLADYISRRARGAEIKGFLKPYGKNDADKDSYIFREGYLTLSTPHGAKGYDAPIVFLIGVDQFDIDEKGRAAFYVGATRSKMVLYLVGLDLPNTLLSEAEAINRVL